jgi:hypothetical protein
MPSIHPLQKEERWAFPVRAHQGEAFAFTSLKETFPFDQRKGRRSMYLLKAFGLPLIYWHGMLKGRL